MTTKRKIRAVGYARRSTDMQERSIPDQKAYVEKWARENGYRILRWYVDDAISGTSVKGRVAFEKMIAAAENGRDFGAILCYDISRFSRGGTNETGYYLHRLQMAGVEAVFCADGIPDGDEGELLQGVKSWQAKQYTVKLSRDVIRGSISYIMNHNSAPGGPPPYGYDRQHLTSDGKILRTFRWMPDGRKQEFGPDGKLVRVLESNEMVRKAKSDIVRFVPSVPERVAIVQRIFDFCIRGYGSQHTAARLNDDGIASLKGGKWCDNQVRSILKNPTYRGAIVWNRRTVGKINGVDGNGNLRPKKRQYQQVNDEQDWYIVENVHDPLVSPEDFEKAQRSIDKRRYAGGKGKTVNRALLAGLIKCSRCGRAYIKKYIDSIYRGNHKRYNYYSDSGYIKGGTSVCKLTNVPMEQLDTWVLQQIKYVLLGDHDGVRQAVDAFVKTVLSGQETPDDTSGVKKELDAVNRRIKATVAMLADPTFDGLDELKTTLADLKRRRDGLQEKLETSAPSRVAAFSESDLRKWATDQLTAIDELIATPNASVEARNLVHAYVDRIEIDPYAKQGVLYLPVDAYGCFTNGFCSWGAHGTDLWHVKKVNPQSMVHLTEKPVELAVRAIQFSSKPGENVLDLFGGSGSTMIACEQTGRNAYLMEIDPLYCDVIVKRYEEFTGKKAQRLGGDESPESEITQDLAAKVVER